MAVSFHLCLLRVTELTSFTYQCCLVCLPSDTVQVLVQEQIFWYFPHLCPGWLAPISMPVTSSSLSQSSHILKWTQTNGQLVTQPALKGRKTVQWTVLGAFLVNYGHAHINFLREGHKNVVGPNWLLRFKWVSLLKCKCCIVFSDIQST